MVANFGATMQPLTKYGQNCTLRPFTTVVKGMQCLPQHTYFGNPGVTNESWLGNGGALKVGVLFPGQGSQHVSMLQGVGDMEEFQALFETANTILGCGNFDITLLFLTTFPALCHPARAVACALLSAHADPAVLVIRCCARFTHVVTGTTSSSFVATAPLTS